jgi:hypothetical protein
VDNCDSGDVDAEMGGDVRGAERREQDRRPAPNRRWV